MSNNVSSEMGDLNHLSIQGMQSFLYPHIASKYIILKQILVSAKKLEILQRKMWIYSAFTQSIREPIAILILLTVLVYSVNVLDETKFSTLILLGLIYKLVNSAVNAQHFWQQCVEFYESIEKILSELERKVTSVSSKVVCKRKLKFGKLKFDGVSCSTYNNQEKIIF